MADNSVTIDVKLKESAAVSGAKKIKTSLDEIKTADGSLNWKGVKEGEKAAKSTGDGYTVLKNVFANLATQGIAMAGGAIKDFAADVINTGQTFETSMSKVAALSGASADELGQLETKARELGATTTFSASQAADAMGYMSLAGWKTADMLDGVGSVLTLAQAGEMDLAAASDLVTDYLSAFNMTAQDSARMVDVLAYAQANANTTVDGLGMAFKNCAANCNAAGMDVETTAAAISMMANQGLKGSEAGTALNAVMRDMTAKMEDGAIKIGEQSIAVMDAEGNYRDFVDILDDVGNATNGMGDAQKAAALQSTFTADSIKGLNLMLNAGAGELDSFREQLYNSGGAAEEIAGTMTDNLGGSFAELQSALEEIQLRIYDGIGTPLKTVVDFIAANAVPAFDGLVNILTTMAPLLVAIGTAIGVYQAYSLALTIAEKARAAATLMVEQAQNLLNNTMKANPIMFVISIISALVAAFMYLWTTNEEFRNFWIGLWDSICQAVSGIAEWFNANIIQPIINAFNAFGSFIGDIWTTITSVINGAIRTVSSIITNVTNIISRTWSTVWNSVSSVASSIWNGITSTIGGAINAAYNVVSTVVNTISNVVGNVFNAIKNTVTTVWNGIKTAIMTPINAARDIVKGAIDAIKGFFSFEIAWPHIPMPHFGINPDGWQIGDLLKGSIPSLRIDWYATGGEFNSPSVIGVGEAGRETVLPLTNKRTMRNVGEAITDAGGMGYDELIQEIRALRRELPRLFAMYCLHTLDIDKRTFARLVKESESYL